MDFEITISITNNQYSTLTQQYRNTSFWTTLSPVEEKKVMFYTILWSKAVAHRITLDSTIEDSSAVVLRDGEYFKNNGLAKYRWLRDARRGQTAETST